MLTGQHSGVEVSTFETHSLRARNQPPQRPFNNILGRCLHISFDASYLLVHPSQSSLSRLNVHLSVTCGRVAEKCTAKHRQWRSLRSCFMRFTARQSLVNYTLFGSLDLTHPSQTPSEFCGLGGIITPPQGHPPPNSRSWNPHWAHCDALTYKLIMRCFRQVQTPAEKHANASSNSYHHREHGKSCCGALDSTACMKQLNDEQCTLSELDMSHVWLPAATGLARCKRQFMHMCNADVKQRWV